MRHKTGTPGIYWRSLANGERRYEISYTDSTGRRIFKTVPGNKKDAEHQLGLIKGRMHRGEVHAPSKLTVNELCELYLDGQTRHLKPNTLVTYTESIDNYIRPLLGRQKVSELKVLQVANYIRDLEAKGLSGDTIRNSLTPLSRMMVFAERSGWSSGNPVKMLDKQERPSGYNKPMRILDRNEINLVLKNSPPSARLLFETAFFTGLRQGELYNLLWKDIDFNESTIRVTSSKTLAGVRLVVAPDFLIRELATEALRNHGEFVFRSGSIGLKTWAGNKRQDLLTALRRSGVTDRFRFHDMRHIFASILISQGHDGVYVAQQMGHANVATTYKYYAKLLDGSKRMEEGRRMMDRDFGSIV